MIADIFLDRFVAQNKAEASPSIGINSLLQIQLFKRDGLLYRLLPDSLNDFEMQLTLDHPVIGDVESGAIFRKSSGKSSLSPPYT